MWDRSSNALCVENYAEKIFQITLKFIRKLPKYNESNTWDRSVKFYKLSDNYLFIIKYSDDERIRGKETNRKDGRAYVQGCKEKIIIGGNMYLYDHRAGAGGAKGKGGSK